MMISTHAPLAGRDPDLRDGYVPEEIISTHAPLAGRDPAPSVTGAINILYFNPRAPCGARRILS